MVLIRVMAREVEGVSLEYVSEGNQLWLPLVILRIMYYGMAITLWIWFLSIIF